MKYKDLAEQLLKCCLALKKDNELQTKKIKAQAEVIETMEVVMIDHGLLKRESAFRLNGSSTAGRSGHGRLQSFSECV